MEEQVELSVFSESLASVVVALVLA